MNCLLHFWSTVLVPARVPPVPPLRRWTLFHVYSLDIGVIGHHTSRDHVQDNILLCRYPNKKVAVQLAAGQLLSSMDPPQMSITKPLPLSSGRPLSLAVSAKENIVMNATGKA